LNYWPRWISAIRKRTATLSLMQMGAYDRLLDHYYAEERALPGDLMECCRVAGAVTKAEQEAVRQVLERFFVLTDVGYANERADEEILVALPKIEAAKANGSKGGRPRGSGKKPSGLPVGLPSGTQDEPTPKHPHPHSPSTPSEQKEAPRKRSAASPLPDCPADVDAQVWVDWTALRTKKRAPVTTTTVDEARKEAVKAGLSLDEFLRVWCMRGSQGLSADWLKPHERGGAVIPLNRQEAIEQRNRAVGDEWLREQEAADASR
jgi:uncharacterized protein YdaU (DUF1376 family)